MNNCDKEKVLISYCLTINNREGTWPYYDCKNVIEKYNLCIKNIKINTKS